MFGIVGGLRVLQLIFRLLEMNWEVIIYYLYSEANKCANFLENLGCHGDYSLIFHEQCPLEVKHLFLVDKCFG